jgi:hypothetical protein
MFAIMSPSTQSGHFDDNQQLKGIFLLQQGKAAVKEVNYSFGYGGGSLGCW